MKGQNNMNEMKQILTKIKEHQKIVIYGHIRPDGDCYGSQFGLKEIIKSTFPQKEVYVTGQTSGYVSFIGKMDIVSDEFCQEALSIVVDTGAPNRISDKRYLTGKEIIKIDHHISEVAHYGHINWVIEEKPACSEMVFDFYRINKLKISLKGAIALYTGIVTDTGGFRYRGVTKSTFETAGDLVGLGVDVEYVNNELSRTTFNELELRGYFLNNIHKSNHFLYVKIPMEVYENFGVSSEDAAALVNQLAGIEGYPVWAIIIEYANKEYRVRMRSTGIPITKIAQKYRGGGHEYACGATLNTWDECEQLAKDVDELVEKITNGN